MKTPVYSRQDFFLIDFMGTLFVVSTPIGNLEDITLRAIKVLGRVNIVLCEDTRKTGRLLKNLKIPEKGEKPLLISYYEENESKRIPEAIKLLKQNQDIALVSNSGTPTISDPGFKLVRECIRQKIKVKSIPGASAALAALVCSGLPTDKFLFLGFLPKKPGKRRKLLENINLIYQNIKPTIIFYESPYRLVVSLKEIKRIFGNIEIAICRELTKLYEEVRKEKLETAISYFEKRKPKGELTLVFRKN